MRRINDSKRLRAFTMIELIVVLVLSSILITICTKVYTNFSHYVSKTLKEQDAINKVVWFVFRLKEDIFKADYVTGDEESFTIYRSGEKTSYDFFSDKVLIGKNDGQAIDTVHVNISDMKVAYIKAGMIKYMEFEYKNDGNTYTFSASKKYSPRFLFESQ